MTAQALPTISQRFGAPTARISRRLSSQTWEVNVVDPICDPDWDRLVTSHPGSSFFHSAAWAKVLCKTYGHKPISLLLSRNAEPVALVPLLEVSSPFTGRRGVCLPFTDFCDPLFFGGCDSGIVSRPLCELARNRNWKYFEIRGGTTSAPWATPSIEILRTYVGSSEWPRSAFRGLCRFGSAGNPQGPTLRPGCSNKPISGSDTGFLSDPHRNAQAARASTAANFIFH